MASSAPAIHSRAVLGVEHDNRDALFLELVQDTVGSATR